MAPWWSRPTAEGAKETETTEETDETKDRPRASSPTDAADAATEEGPDEESTPRRGRRGGRSGRGSSPAAADAPPTGPTGERDAPAGKTSDREKEREDDDTKRSEGRRGRSGRTRSPQTRARKPAAAPVPEPEPKGRIRPGETMTVAVAREEEKPREIVITVPERGSMFDVERRLGVFCDLENVALGARDSGVSFDINLVLERLVEKGKIIVKRAYCDWNRYSEYKRAFHEAGIEMIDIPQKRISGKNSADIKMVVDAMDLSYSKEHLNTFVLVSGDSDFSPLVSKLKENNKHVIGVGVKNSSSNLLIDNCDEFIYYEDIWRDVESAPKVDNLPDKEQEVFGLLVDSILALQRENKDVLWGSMIKQTMQRKRPSFNEGYYGYSTFSELLEDAEAKKIVNIKKDQRSGSYIVTGFSRGSRSGRRR